MSESLPTSVLLAEESPLYEQLMRFVRDQRWVFFAGLPGTGKSLWMHQLTHLAAAAGRRVSLLQWDTARPVFEQHPAGQPYPVVEGVTHGVIRLAVGRWARQALVDWHQRHPESHAMLIGETPLIGHRLIELARVERDPAEPLLRQPSCVFVIPVPAPHVRQHIEAERQRRATTPVHEHEREDAPPHVLQALWEELARLAPRLGVHPGVHTLSAPYDPEVYQAVYHALLKHRHTEVLRCEVRLPTTTFSVYDYACQPDAVIPRLEEVGQYIQDVEQQYPEALDVQRQIAQWYQV